jgi:hypothetical protein
LKGQAANVTFVIDAIRFVSPTVAEVDFRILYLGRPSPVIPGVVHGGAVLQDGRWRVSKATTCALSTAMRIACLP